MSAFTMGKVRVATTGGQAVLLVLLACGPDAARTVLVEADTTGVASLGVDFPSRAAQPGEGALPDTEALALEEGAAEEGLRQGQSDRAARPSPARRAPSRRRPVGSGDGEADAVTGEAEAPIGPRGPGDRPRPPLLLSSGRVLLQPGTVLAAELRTPLHTATTVVGDRFAARLTQAVAAGGRIVIPAGALVEGRVGHVGNADEPGYIAFLQLEPRSVRNVDGRRLRITADVLDVTGLEVVEPGRGPGRARAGVANGSSVSGSAAADARRAVLGSILIGLAGRAIVAPTADQEIIVPAGTTFTLELIEPLEIPAP